MCVLPPAPCTDLAAAASLRLLQQQPPLRGAILLRGELISSYAAWPTSLVVRVSFCLYSMMCVAVGRIFFHALPTAELRTVPIGESVRASGCVRRRRTAIPSASGARGETNAFQRKLYLLYKYGTSPDAARAYPCYCCSAGPMLGCCCSYVGLLFSRPSVVIVEEG